MMKKFKNDTFIRALLCQPTEYTPIWLMRQAGRYLPEYNEIRKRAGSFLGLCKNPALAAEVTLQPLARFDLDAAILFSDILVIPDAMGLGLYFSEGEGPKFERPLRSKQEVDKLLIPDPNQELRYVIETIGEIRKTLNNRVPLIGFSGSPFTLACYMIEGGGSEDFKYTKNLLYQYPEILHQILKVNTKAITDYLNAQIEAGVDAVMLFDTWGGILSADAYREFSLIYIKQIINGIKHPIQPIPSILFTKGAGGWLTQIVQSGANAIGLDWSVDIKIAKEKAASKVALQGNLDPMILLMSEEVIKAETKKILDAFGKGEGHIFNLGHGVLPSTPPENIKLLVDSVHELSCRYHNFSKEKTPI